MDHMAAVFLVGFQCQLARVYEAEGLVGGSGDSQQACSWMLRDHERIWEEVSGRSHQGSSLAKRKLRECSEYGYFMHEDDLDMHHD